MESPRVSISIPRKGRLLRAFWAAIMPPAAWLHRARDLVDRRDVQLLLASRHFTSPLVNQKAAWRSLFIFARR